MPFRIAPRKTSSKPRRCTSAMAALAMAVVAIMPTAARAAPPDQTPIKLFIAFPMHHDNVEDIFDQTNPAHAWPNVLRNTAVISFSDGYILRPHAPVATIVAFLKQHNIKMSLAINVVLQGKDTSPPTYATTASGQQTPCGHHVPASGTPSDAGVAIDKIQQAGGRVDFVTLDEPLYFGHEYTHNLARGDQSYGCQWSIPQVAGMVKAAVQSINRVNTNANIRYAEWEPMGNRLISADQKFADIQAWEPALTQVLGQKITYMFSDANLLGTGRDSLQDTQSLMLRLKPWLAQYGNIELIANCIGDKQTPDSAAWGEEAIQNCRRAEQLGLKSRSIALWANWIQRMPEQLVPETLPGSYTNDMLRYLTGN